MINQKDHRQQTNNDDIHMPYTLEKQLEAYAKHPQKIERQEILYHTWYQNKKWLTSLLETTIITYTNYSRHDGSHAESVIHNIERVLGEERIRMLSPTDCFLLLHIAYVHDIGMYITAEDRLNMVESDRFDDLLDNLERSADSMQKKWAECIKKICYIDLDGRDKRNKDLSDDEKRQLYKGKLDVYHAITNVLAEFYRSQHGIRSKKRLLEWTEEPTKLGSGFAMSGIPMRIFYRIAECAALHTSYEFQDILALPQEDSGFAHDMMHPRFAAVLLQLGDALDMDNNRFHPLVHDITGEMPRISQVHFEKHAAIRTLNITPTEITIEADCKNIDVLREIRKECQWIESLLENAGYYWPKIMPPSFIGSLPTLNISKLLYAGLSIPQELINARFDISKEKAFNILEGSKVYEDYFPFLRELLQNAVDATKLQFWKDYTGSTYYQQNIITDKNFGESTFDIMKNFSTLDYPVEIFLTVKAVDRYNNFVEPSDRERLEQLQNNDELDYGVLVEIQDHGIGISKEDIVNISNVGESYTKKRMAVEKMPPILRPTGAFGIGLQSVFTVATNFKCKSKTHTGECYEFIFSSPSIKNEGQINTQALDPNSSLQYGTRFEVFIPRKEKIDHHRFLRAWAGIDPFAEDYDTVYKLHEAEELMTQMVYYIREMLGEKIFPICVIADDPFSNELPYNLQQQVLGNDNVALKVWTKGAKKIPIKKEEMKKTLTWVFQKENLKTLFLKNIEEDMEEIHTYGALIEGDKFYFDLDTFKLNIWSEKIKAFASLGASRILEKYIGEDDKKSKIRLCYKGIEVGFVEGESGDFDLIEAIDLKEDQTAEILLLNREQLTPKGKKYIYEIVIPEILQTLERVYKTISNRIQKIYKEYEYNSTEEFSNAIGEVLENLLNKVLYRSEDESDKKEDSSVEDERDEKEEFNPYIEEVFGDDFNEKESLNAIIDELKVRGLWYTDVDENQLIEVIGEFEDKRVTSPTYIRQFKKLLCLLEEENLISPKNNLISIASSNIFQFEDKGKENSLKMLSLIFLVYRAKVSHLYTEQTSCCCTKKSGQNLWEIILHEIARFLDEIFIHNAHKRLIFHEGYLTVPVMKYRNPEIINMINLAEILSDKDRYFIYSEREKRDLDWKHRLVQISRGEITEWPPSIKSMENFLILRGRNTAVFFDNYNGDTQFADYIGKWMLYNIPTEKFATRLENIKDDGNRRLNLLNIKSSAEVELNKDILYLLLKKMQERKKKYTAMRFATVVWKGVKCLKIKKIPHTVCEVNRGFVSAVSKPKMILPFSSEYVNKILNLYRKPDSGGNYTAIWRLDTKFVAQLSKMAHYIEANYPMNLPWRVRTYVEQLVKERSKELREKQKYTYRNFMGLEMKEQSGNVLFKNKGFDFTIYNQTLEDEEAEGYLDKVKATFRENKAKLDELLDVLSFAQEGINEVLCTHFFKELTEQELIYKCMGKNKFRGSDLNPDIKNLIKYVTKYSDMKPSSEQIEKLYFGIFEELFLSVRMVETREFTSYLEELGLEWIQLRIEDVEKM